MVQVHPFRALHFETKVVGDLSRVTSQPYDKINDELQQKYYDRHENHIVRILRGKDQDDDSETVNRYTRANGFLKEWQEKGVLTRDEKPAFYAYRQVYDKGRKTRRGFTAMVGLEEPGKGHVLPHEQTHIGPKIDRFKLINQTMTHFGHIFLLYSDPERKVNAILDKVSKGDPVLASIDDFGERHEAWPVTDPEDIKVIQELMAERDAIIADGHHRYETAYKFKLDLEKAGAASDGTETHMNVLATLVNMNDEGMTLYPTHRIVDEVEGYSRAALKEKLSVDFDVKTVSEIELGPYSFGIVDQESEDFLVATLKDKQIAIDKIGGSNSDGWKLLDVNVMHNLILHPLLGVTPDDLAHERKVSFMRHTSEVVEAVREKKTHRVGVIVNPCTVEQILTLTKAGERFPQKTTDFYPKLLSGFLMCRLETSREGLEKLK